MMRWIRSRIHIQSIVEYLKFYWFLVSVEFQFERRKIRSPSSSVNRCRWSTWRGFLKGMLRKGWFSSCVISSEREVRINSIIFQILWDRLSKETQGCRWCMRIAFLDLVRSLVTYRLPFFISLNRLSVSLNSLIHLHHCIRAGCCLVAFSSVCLIALTIILDLFDPLSE